MSSIPYLKWRGCYLALSTASTNNNGYSASISIKSKPTKFSRNSDVDVATPVVIIASSACIRNRLTSFGHVHHQYQMKSVLLAPWNCELCCSLYYYSHWDIVLVGKISTICSEDLPQRPCCSATPILYHCRVLDEAYAPTRFSLLG